MNNLNEGTRTLPYLRKVSVATIKCIKKRTIISVSLLLMLTVVVVSCKKGDNSPEKKDEDTSTLNKKRITSMVEIGKDSIIFKYDDLGNLVKTTVYDNTHKLSFEQENRYENNKPISITSYTFDYAGKKQGYGKDSISYDNNNKVIQVINCGFYNGIFYVMGTDAIDYNSDGYLSLITQSNGNYTYYTYDTNGNVITSKVLVAGNVYNTSFQYDNKINPFKGNPYNFLAPSYLSNNNLVSYSGVNYEYKYDTDGYPIEKMISSITIAKFYYNK